MDRWIEIDLNPLQHLMPDAHTEDESEEEGVEEGKEGQTPKRVIIRNSSPTIEKAWEMFADRKKNLPRGWKKKVTVEGRESKYNKWIKPHFGHMHMNTITEAHLEKWIKHLIGGLAPQGVRDTFNLLRNMFLMQKRLDKRDQREGKVQYRFNGKPTPFDTEDWGEILPKGKKDPYRRVYTNDELLAIADTAMEHDRTLYYLLRLIIDTGMRISEVRALRWNRIQDAVDEYEENGKTHKTYGIIDIDSAVHEKSFEIELPKYELTRQVPINESLAAVLSEWANVAPRVGETAAIQVPSSGYQPKKRKRPDKMNIFKRRKEFKWVQWGADRRGGAVQVHTHAVPEGFVFCNPDGSVYSANTLRDRCNKILKKAGVKKMGCVFHEFRHGYITLAVNSGIDLKWIQRTAGHLDLRTTLGYMQNSKYEPAKAAKMISVIHETQKAESRKRKTINERIRKRAKRDAELTKELEEGLSKPKSNRGRNQYQRGGSEQKSSKYMGVTYQQGPIVNPKCKTCSKYRKPRKDRNVGTCQCDIPIWLVKGNVVDEADLPKYRSTRKRPWVATIKHNGKQHRIGSYATEEEAARAWDAQQVDLKGEMVKLNFIKEWRNKER